MKIVTNVVFFFILAVFTKIAIGGSSQLECKALVFKPDKQTSSGRFISYTQSMEHIDFQSVLDPSEFSIAVASAELSKEIYNCRKKCKTYRGASGFWKVLFDSRELQLSSVEAKEIQEAIVASQRDNTTANSTTSIILEETPDPDGFHATAYKNTSTGAVIIVYEGTTSVEDWITNLGQLVSIPAQYQLAKDFAQSVLMKACPNDSSVDSQCRRKVTVTGHSLGGGLAQFASLTTGLQAYIFNAAGLLRPTRKELNPHASKVVHFHAQGYRFNTEYGRDFVPDPGEQFAQVSCQVPVTLPVWAWDTITVELQTHNMEKLFCAMFDLHNEVFTSLSGLNKVLDDASAFRYFSTKTNLGEESCSFELTKPGKLKYKGKAFSSQLIIPHLPAGGNLATELEVFSNASPGGRYYVVQAVHLEESRKNSGSARYIVDTSKLDLFHISLGEPPIDKWYWSPDASSLVYIKSSGDSYRASAIKLPNQNIIGPWLKSNMCNMSKNSIRNTSAVFGRWLTNQAFELDSPKSNELTCNTNVIPDHQAFEISGDKIMQ